MLDWFHSLPTIPLALVIALAVLVVAIGGLALAIRPLRRLQWLGQLDNSTVAGLLSALVGIYAVAAGLTAVAVWSNAGDATLRINREVTAMIVLNHLYGSFPSEVEAKAKTRLYEYAQNVIDVEWPAHLRGEPVGIVPEALASQRRVMTSFEPTTEGQKIVHAEMLREFARLLEARRDRIQAAEETALPGPLWAVVTLLGSIAIAGSYLLRTDSFGLHVLVTGLIATPIALLMFFIAVTDQPFRGGIAASDQPYRLVQSLILETSPPGMLPVPGR